MSSDNHPTRGRPSRLNGRWMAGSDMDEDLDDDGFYAGRPVRSGRPLSREFEGGGKARRRPQRRDKRGEDAGY